MKKSSSYKTKEKSSSVSRNRKKEKRGIKGYMKRGAVFESIFTESKDLTKDEFYQLITSLIRKEEANLKILKIIESREETESKNIENQEIVTDIEE